MYKQILVAVDGSATSLRGLDEAIKVATAMSELAAGQQPVELRQPRVSNA